MGEPNVSTPWSFPRPWAVSDLDGRISIVAADGSRVTEVYPGQHLGQVPTPAICRAIAEDIVEAVNAAS